MQKVPSKFQSWYFGYKPREELSEKN